MKYYIHLILSFVLAFSMFAQTNNVPPAPTPVPQSSLNEIFISMLQGARDVGSELYSAGKTAITKSVDFAMSEVPKVVEEFLRWRAFEAITEMSVTIVWVLTTLLLMYIAYRFIKKFNPNEHPIENPVFWTCILLLLVVCMPYKRISRLEGNVMTIVKIKTAPRVYLIEWTGEQVEKYKKQSK